jgi:hypothetical protein
VDRRDELIQTRTIRRRMFFALAGWAAMSWAIGLVILLTIWTSPFAQAAAAQCVIWGLLNTAFALFGLRQAQQADRTPITSAALQREFDDRDRLSRVLHFAGRLSLAFLALSVIILVAGVALKSAQILGHGAAMMTQTAFLYFYDRTFAARLASTRFHAKNQPDNATSPIAAPGPGR